jgi:hypothetical protein
MIKTLSAKCAEQLSLMTDLSACCFGTKNQLLVWQSHDLRRRLHKRK